MPLHRPMPLQTCVIKCYPYVGEKKNIVNRTCFRVNGALRDADCGAAGSYAFQLMQWSGGGSSSSRSRISSSSSIGRQNHAACNSNTQQCACTAVFHHVLGNMHDCAIGGLLAAPQNWSRHQCACKHKPHVAKRCISCGHHCSDAAWPICLGSAMGCTIVALWGHGGSGIGWVHVFVAQLAGRRLCASARPWRWLVTNRLANNCGSRS